MMIVVNISYMFMLVEVLAAPHDDAGHCLHAGCLASLHKLLIGLVPELIQQPVEVLHLSAPALSSSNFI